MACRRALAPFFVVAAARMWLALVSADHATGGTCNEEDFTASAEAAAAAMRGEGPPSESGWRDQYALHATFSPGNSSSIGPKVYVSSSPVHGRGVFAGADFAEGETVALLWFDYVHVVESGNGDDFVFKNGYIPAGSDLHEATQMTVGNAKKLCSRYKACDGFTFSAGQGQACCVQKCSSSRPPLVP